MFQLYALFVLALGFSGFMLAYSFLDEKLGCSAMFNPEGLLAGKTYLWIGILLGILSVLRLVFVSPNDIIIVGDILPAAVGILSSLLLLSEYAIGKNDDAPVFFVKLHEIFMARRTLSGILVMIVALAHFLFPSVPVI